MNLILVTHDEVDEHGQVMLGGRRAQHIRDVLRARPGDELRLGVIGGRRGTGRVLVVNTSIITMDATWMCDATPEPAVDLILAMPRPKVLSRVLQTVACMGVRRIDVVNAWRVDKSYLHSPRLDPGVLRDNLVLGCEQAGTTWMPDIEIHRRLMPFISEVLRPRMADGPCRAVIAHPRTELCLESVFESSDACGVDRTIVAIGPERGWIDRELDSFAQLGFVCVSLGNSVLRVETAVTSALAQVSLLQRLHASPATDAATSPVKAEERCDDLDTVDSSTVGSDSRPTVETDSR